MYDREIVEGMNGVKMIVNTKVSSKVLGVGPWMV